MTDTLFGVTSDLQSKLHSDTAPVYSYIYDYTIENFIFPDDLGKFLTIILEYICICLLFHPLWGFTDIIGHFSGTFHALECILLYGYTMIHWEENEAAKNHSGVTKFMCHPLHTFQT